ncbi:MAG TPA: hypothetical protein VFM87_02585 [Agrococcus sp.]|nr:hypothetical protein [Agrococcus sp.]
MPEPFVHEAPEETDVIDQQQTDAAPVAPQRTRDPQSFMRSDKIAITVAISIGLALSIVAIALFVTMVVVPSL